MKLLTHIRMLFKISRKKDERLPSHLKAGKAGEDAAAKYLRRKGYRPVCRNFTSGKNEIDIIVKTKDTYIFCEVKTRVQEFAEALPFGRPASAVDHAKQRHLIAAATTFSERHKRENMYYRFDVLEVYLTPSGKVSHIHHIENAFTR